MDREKIIKGVHDARRYLEDREWVDKSVGVHIDALNDALAMLKEQDEQIRFLKENLRKASNYIELIKDKLDKITDNLEGR